MGKHGRLLSETASSGRRALRVIVFGSAILIVLSFISSIFFNSTVNRRRPDADVSRIALLTDTGTIEVGPAGTTASISTAASVDTGPGTATATATMVAAGYKFDGRRAYKYVKRLTDCGPRVSGSPEEYEAAEVIESIFEGAGYTVDRQAFTAPNGKIAYNVSAVKPAAGAGKSTGRWAAIGAHYDTVSGTTGANDNASGAAVVMEIANDLRGLDLPYDLRFVLFSSEENENPDRDSYAGSAAFVNGLSPSEKTAMIGYINLDMVGWPGAGYSIGNLGLADRKLFDLASGLARERGLPFVSDRGYSVRRSDHQSFEKAGIPTVSFGAADYPYHHQPSDSLDKVAPERLAGIGSLVLRLLPEID